MKMLIIAMIWFGLYACEPDYQVRPVEKSHIETARLEPIATPSTEPTRTVPPPSSRRIVVPVKPAASGDNDDDGGDKGESDTPDQPQPAAPQPVEPPPAPEQQPDEPSGGIREENDGPAPVEDCQHFGGTKICGGDAPEHWTEE